MIPTAGGYALFGGSFNPVHKGHVRLVTEVRRRCRFRSVLVIPCNIQPLKGLPAIPGRDRLKMLKLAFRGKKGVQVSDYELRRRGPSYSYATVRHFRKMAPKRRIFFVTGADAFADFPRWYRFRELLGLCSFVVVSRPGARGLDSTLKKLSKMGLVREIPAARPFTKTFVTRRGTSIGVLDAYTADVSSTEVRMSLARGHIPADKLPSPIARYLRTHSAYGNSRKNVASRGTGA